MKKYQRENSYVYLIGDNVHIITYKVKKNGEDGKQVAEMIFTRKNARQIARYMLEEAQ